MRLVLDLESNGLLPQMSKVHCIVLYDIDKKEYISCADQEGYLPISHALSLISKATLLIGHNIIKFDVPALSKIYPGLKVPDNCLYFDTLIVSRLLWPELEPLDRSRWNFIETKYYGRHSLAAWGERLGVQKIKFKETSKSDEIKDVWENWTKEMQDYCEGDVTVSVRLYDYLLKQKADQRSLDLEHEFAIIMAKQEQFGFPFDEKNAFVLVNKLKAKREEIREELQKVFPPITEERISTKTGKQLKSKVTIFNPASRQQTAERLQILYPEIKFDSTDKGNPQVDDDVLELLGDKYPEAKMLAEYQLLNKRLGQIAEGKEAWLKHCNVYGDGRIHGGVNTNACISGRCSHCIEENQRVTTPAGLVPIKDIKTGDYVYSYTSELELRANKVLEVIPQGNQECYVLHWRTNGPSKKGTIICTENHKFLMRDGSYKRLKDLRVGEKISHLTVTISDGRKMLNMTNRRKVRQCTFIKENIFGFFGREYHIHHIDYNKLNDDLNNLEVLTAAEHAVIHHSGENNSGYISATKFSLLRRLATSKGRPVYVKMDFDTFKKKCKEYGISIKHVRSRYSKVTGKYITKRMVHTMLQNNWTPYKAGKEFNVDWRKSRIDSLLESHGIIPNHYVERIEYLGVRNTYDLNVDSEHNFICEELCVSNSHPNVSQVPSVGHTYGKECRSLFTAVNGWKLVGTDASALELRALGAWLAYFDDGEYARLVSTEGFDIHAHNAKLFGIWDGNSNIEKKQRNLSKACIFAVCYGAGAKKVGSLFDSKVSESKMTSRGREVIDTFYKNLPSIKQLKDLLESRINDRGHLIGIDGRQLQIRSKHAALNQLLQSTGAILMKKAVCIFYNSMQENGLIHGEDWGMCAFIHDELQKTVKPEHAELTSKLAIRSIQEAGKFFNLKCPFNGESRIGVNWMECH